MSGFPYALLLPEKHSQDVGISRFPYEDKGKQRSLYQNKPLSIL